MSRGHQLNLPTANAVWSCTLNSGFILNYVTKDDIGTKQAILGYGQGGKDNALKLGYILLLGKTWVKSCWVVSSVTWGWAK